MTKASPSTISIARLTFWLLRVTYVISALSNVYMHTTAWLALLVAVKYSTFSLEMIYSQRSAILVRADLTNHDFKAILALWVKAKLLLTAKLSSVQCIMLNGLAVFHVEVPIQIDDRRWRNWTRVKKEWEVVFVGRPCKAKRQGRSHVYLLLGQRAHISVCDVSVSYYSTGTTFIVLFVV